MGNTRSNDSKIFGGFLNRLSKLIVSEDEEKAREIILVMDNSSIHTSDHIRAMLKQRQVRILTITPYEPSLNACEKLILRIKTSLKSRYLYKKSISLQTIKTIVDGIEENELAQMQNSSIEEAMLRAEDIFK
jgi:transposase